MHENQCDSGGFYLFYNIAHWICIVVIQCGHISPLKRILKLQKISFINPSNAPPLASSGSSSAWAQASVCFRDTAWQTWKYFQIYFVSIFSDFFSLPEFLRHLWAEALSVVHGVLATVPAELEYGHLAMRKLMFLPPLTPLTMMARASPHSSTTNTPPMFWTLRGWAFESLLLSWK